MKISATATIENSQFIINYYVQDELVTVVFSKENIKDLPKFVLDNDMDSIKLKLDVYIDRSVEVTIKNFKAILRSNLDVSTAGFVEIYGCDDGISVKQAHALSCIFSLSVKDSEQLLNMMFKHYLFVRGNFQWDSKRTPAELSAYNVISKLNCEYDTVIAAVNVDSQNLQIFRSLAILCGLRLDLIDFDITYRIFKESSIVIERNGQKFYTYESVRAMEDRFHKLIDSKSTTKLNTPQLSAFGGDKDQYEASLAICEGGDRVRILNALAGCGKSHVASQIVASNPGQVLATAYFNKANSNLGDRLTSGYSVKFTRMTPQLTLETKTLNKPWSLYKTYYNLRGLELKNIRLFIVDEGSVLSNVEMDMVVTILGHCHPECKLLILGDLNQIYPVNSRGIPMLNAYSDKKSIFSRLTTNHRGVTALATTTVDVSGGRFVVKNNNDSVRTSRMKMDAVAKLAIKHYSNALTTSSAGIISKYNAHCNTINTAMNMHYNKGGSSKLYVGLRLMAKETTEVISKNQIFTVRAFTKDSVTLENENDKEITIERKDFDFEPAWCVTVHKYQGSQVDNMIVLVDTTKWNPFERNRNMNVVAMSRAKRVLHLVDLNTTIEDDTEIEMSLCEYPIVTNTRRKCKPMPVM